MPQRNIIAEVLSAPQSRFLTIAKEAVSQEGRTVSLSFSSEEPVEQWYGFEILDHSPGACDLSRLNNGAPLMDNHRGLIGKIESCSIDADRVGRCMARFSRAAKAEEMFQDVLDEIRTKSSVGYRVFAMVLEKTENGVETYRVTKWQPYEVSLADIPADDTVGVGRTMEFPHNQPIRTGEKVMPPTPEEQAVIDAAQRTQAEATQRSQTQATLTAERTRVTEIGAIATRFAHVIPEMNALREKAINEGWTVDSVRCQVLEKMTGAQPIANPTPTIGMSENDKRTYSLTRAIRMAAEGRPLDGIEGEASRAAAKLSRRDEPAKGFIVPDDIVIHKNMRSLTNTDSTKGGYLIGTNVMVGETIELLRNKSVVMDLGAKVLTGLVGNIAIPRITGGAQVYWLPASGNVPPSDMSFGQLAMSPHRIIVNTSLDKEFMNQTSADAEGMVRDDFNKVINLEIDRASIAGSGANGEPIGIMNIPTGLGSVTFGAAATWLKILEFETALATANADLGRIAFLTSPGVRGKWKGIQKAANLPFIWEAGANGGGQVNGYRAEATNQVALNKVIFGNWEDLIIAFWAGIDVVVDPYTLARNGQVALTMTNWADIGGRHAGSFVISTDSGAQ
jgi:HK97 family phage major capsid protein